MIDYSLPVWSPTTQTASATSRDRRGLYVEKEVFGKTGLVYQKSAPSRCGKARFI